jgi:hypothetical protein
VVGYEQGSDHEKVLGLLKLGSGDHEKRRHFVNGQSMKPKERNFNSE